MFKFLLLFALFGSSVDEYCQEMYGHPGDLGVTKAATAHFNPRTTYHEAVATIGAQGQEIVNKQQDRKTYRWQKGKLEMEFRNDRLVSYRFDDVLRVFTDSVDQADETSEQYQKLVDERQKKRTELEQKHRQGNQAAMIKNQESQAAFERSMRGLKKADEVRHRKAYALECYTTARQAQEIGNLQIAEQLLQFGATHADRVKNLTGDDALAKQILEAKIELRKLKSQQ